MKKLKISTSQFLHNFCTNFLSHTKKQALHERARDEFQKATQMGSKQGQSTAAWLALGSAEYRLKNYGEALKVRFFVFFLGKNFAQF